MNLQKEISPPSSFDKRWTCLNVDLGAVSDTGLVRENNQDSYLVMKFGRSLENLMTNLHDNLFEPGYFMSGYGMLVADGMGGMAAGDVASRLALSKLVELIVDTSDWTLALQRDHDVTTVLHRMTERFLQIDEILRKEADNDQSLQGMGTTLTVAGALGSDLIIGHVGDSRAYLMHEDNLTQLTTDHTLAQALIDAGVVNPDDPASRSMRHVLTAAVGSLGEQVDPQVQRFTLHGGDKLLLCTDGLTEMVDDATIAQVLREVKSAQTACQNLVDLALAGGGTDNITVVLAHFVS
ncbi:MAG TPA: protein phosphatase 2C domain-containing protein [Pyrinomonadaceae bacterium]|nr:protein phosphatase 2C domain-containing protein [Pyrinomonadaceae bacterium]